MGARKSLPRWAQSAAFSEAAGMPTMPASPMVMVAMSPKPTSRERSTLFGENGVRRHEYEGERLSFRHVSLGEGDLIECVHHEHSITHPTRHHHRRRHLHRHRLPPKNTASGMPLTPQATDSTKDASCTTRRMISKHWSNAGSLCWTVCWHHVTWSKTGNQNEAVDQSIASSGKHAFQISLKWA